MELVRGGFGAASCRISRVQAAHTKDIVVRLLRPDLNLDLAAIVDRRAQRRPKPSAVLEESPKLGAKLGISQS
jgi:hypothetical protein